MDAKALLDSLMGNDRNAGKKDAGKQQDAWREDQICKNFLVGFCPHDFFLNDEGKQCPRSPFSECPKQHSDAMKQRFEKDKDYQKYRYRYLQDMERLMRRQVESVNLKRDNERAKLERGEAHSQKAVKSHMDAREAVVAAKVSEAEKLGITGELDSAQNLMEEVKERQAKLDKMKGQHEDRLEKICEACGATLSWTDSGNAGYGTAHGHFMGALHLGWVQMRERLVEVQDELKKGPPASAADDPNDPDKDRRRRSDSAGIERVGDRYNKDGDAKRSGRGADDSQRGRRASPEADRSRRRSDGDNRDRDDRYDDRRRGDVRDGRGGNRSRERGDDRRRGADRDAARGDDRRRGADRDAARGSRRGEEKRKPSPKKEYLDAFGRDTRIARHESENERKIHVKYSDDWQEVMQSKFAASKLAMNEWDMNAFDSEGRPLDLNSPEVRLSLDSFPLEFRFKKKKGLDEEPKRSRSRSRSRS